MKDSILMMWAMWAFGIVMAFTLLHINVVGLWGITAWFPWLIAAINAAWNTDNV